MDVEKYRKLFLEECREHLQSLNQELVRLEGEGEGFDGIDTLFRAAHSIKGMAGSMGYDSMVSLSHALEDILDGIRRKSLQVQPDLISQLLESVDALGHMADEVEEKGAPALAVEAIVDRLRSACSGTPAPGTAPAAPGEIDLDHVTDSPEKEAGDAAEGDPGEMEISPALWEKIVESARQGKATYSCRLAIDRETASLTARNFVVLGKMNKVGAILHSAPRLEEVMEGRGRETVNAYLATEKSEPDLEALFRSVPELTSVEIRRIVVEDAEEKWSRQATQKEAAQDGEGAGEGAGKGTRKADASRKLIDRYLPRSVRSIRVETGVLDGLINIVGELIINRDRLMAVSRDLESEDLHLSLDRLDVLVRGFQDTIMTVRMMPIEIVTDRLPRVVRDLARQGGKEIRFEIVGQRIELDRAILEELSDVLIHLVRNAIDHGIESVAERRSAGKSEKALVRITAGRERDWVWISVEDDGRGMDPEAIARKAVERGLVPREEAEAMDRNETLLLACLPGLSTAGKVSDVSGRGVGMDIVKSKVESFGGSLLIESAPGAGTKTTMRLPLTLAIVRSLLVEVQGQVFSLPVSHIAHTVRIGPDDVEQSGNRTVMRWEGKMIPLLGLAELVGISAAAGRPAASFPVVLTEQDGRITGLAVDRLIGTYETVIKPLGLPLKQVRGLAGATIVSDGRTVLVLDVKALV